MRFFILWVIWLALVSPVAASIVWEQPRKVRRSSSEYGIVRPFSMKTNNFFVQEGENSVIYWYRASPKHGWKSFTIPMGWVK